MDDWGYALKSQEANKVPVIQWYQECRRQLSTLVAMVCRNLHRGEVAGNWAVAMGNGHFDFFLTKMSSVISNLMKTRQEDCWKSKAKLGYVMGSRVAYATERPCFNKRTNQKGFCLRRSKCPNSGPAEAGVPRWPGIRWQWLSCGRAMWRCGGCGWVSQLHSRLLQDFWDVVAPFMLCHVLSVPLGVG